MFNKLLGVILLLSGLLAEAQIPVAQLRSANDLERGLLTTVYQDSHGWIWLGSQHGVFRYDGQEIMPVRFPAGADPGAVSALFESGRKLWVGFESGAIAFLENLDSGMPQPSGDFREDLRRSPQLTMWNPEEGLPSARISGFATDKLGGFWISTYQEGVYVWKNNRLYQFNREDDQLSSNDIYAMTSDLQGRIWLATDGGISVCAMLEPGKKQVLNLGMSAGLPDEIVTAITADNHGHIWCGTNDRGVFRYNTENWQVDFVSSNWSYGPVTQLQAYGDVELWVATEKSGLVRYDAVSGLTIAMPEKHALAATRFRSLCKDREGLLWLVTQRGDLYSANVRFGVIKPPFSHIQAICTDSKGGLWAGTQEGLYRRDGLNFTQVLPGKQNVVSLWVSPLDQSIWAGTLGNGVFLVGPDGNMIRHLSENQLCANGSVLSITGDQSRVWLATLGGVCVLHAVTLQPEPGVVNSELGRNYVYRVMTDSRNRVWFGTDGNGLVVYENGRFQSFTEAEGIKLRTIYSVVEDQKGNIWFSTARDGLFRFDGQSFKRFTSANHLHNMEIAGLAVDGNNQIVIGYDDGFDLLNPDRFDHLNFYGIDAINTPIEVNLNALWQDAGGNVWLGTENNIIRVAAYSEPMVDDPEPGITGVSVFLQPVDFQKTNVFSYDQNSVLFNFVGLWYSNPESVRYRYRLDGYDLEWKVSKDHTASYPKLPPGGYTFRVQTSEHGNFENVPESAWSFRVEPPFWQRWWFLSLLFGSVFAMIRAFVQARESRLRREAQLNRERVESQFETLKSQINPHFLFNSFNTLITIIEENPKMAVAYVEHLSDFYRSIMVYRERDFIKLSEEMELVRSFDFLLKKRYEDGFHLVDRLNGQTGMVMPLSLQMLVENAVKHNVISRSKPLTVEIFAENDHIVVRNNIQRKIKTEPSTHFGLQSLINRYKLLGERPVTVEDNEAFFTVKIPILQA